MVRTSSGKSSFGSAALARSFCIASSSSGGMSCIAELDTSSNTLKNKHGNYVMESSLQNNSAQLHKFDLLDVHVFQFSGKCRATMLTNIHQTWALKKQTLLKNKSFKIHFWNTYSKKRKWTMFGSDLGIWAVQKYVNLVDLVKNYPTSTYFQNRRRYSRVRASQSLEVIQFNFVILLLDKNYGLWELLTKTSGSRTKSDYA